MQRLVIGRLSRLIQSYLQRKGLQELTLKAESPHRLWWDRETGECNRNRCRMKNHKLPERIRRADYHEDPELVVPTRVGHRERDLRTGRSTLKPHFERITTLSFVCMSASAHRKYPVVAVDADCRVLEYVDESSVVGLYSKGYGPYVFVVRFCFQLCVRYEAL